MVLLTICDIIWAIIMSFVWNHNDKGTGSDYWDSLAWMHSMIYWFGIFELLLKVGLIAYLSVDFKKIAPISEPPSPVFLNLSQFSWLRFFVGIFS